MSIGTEVLVVLLLAVVNGVLSMSEIALVSARKVRLQQRADEGDRGAAAALTFRADPGRFLSTVQVGITLVGILAGVFGGATLAGRLADVLGRWQVLASNAEPIAMGLVVLAITYLTLVVGELVPKQLALASPEAIASWVARPLNALAVVSKPVVQVLDSSTKLLLRILPRRRDSEQPITEGELRHLLEQGTHAGVFEAGEQEIVARVVRLGERRVGDVATPRSEMVALDVNASSETNWRRVADSPHLYFPVYDSTPDRLLGVVSVKDLWRETVAGSEPDLRKLVRDPLYLPESVSPLRALERVRSSGRQIAVVLDEHGGIEGLITLHDLLEAIVGALPTTADAEPLVVERPDGSWLVDGLLATEELARLLAIAQRGSDWWPESHTLGGLAMERLARLPQAGDQFEWHGFRFEVVDMDGRRVDKVLIERIPVSPRSTTPAP